jgi:hypothetical protein
MLLLLIGDLKLNLCEGEMKFEDIMNEWEKDSKIDETELARESLKTSQLHSKYLKMLTQEAMSFKKVDLEYKKMFRLKYQYFMGVLDKETLDEYGWEPNPMKIIKQDLPMYIDSDDEMQQLSIRLDVQKQKISFLESVIKTISNRGFLIKNAVDWQKFTSGIA